MGLCLRDKKRKRQEEEETRRRKKKKEEKEEEEEEEEEEESFELGFARFLRRTYRIDTYARDVFTRNIDDNASPTENAEVQKCRCATLKLIAKVHLQPNTNNGFFL